VEVSSYEDCLLVEMDGRMNICASMAENLSGEIHASPLPESRYDVEIGR
jgi:hypothetical protein